MNRGLARRVKRLESAIGLLEPEVVVIELENGRLDRPVPTRADGRPIRVIYLPKQLPIKEEEIRIMALPPGWKPLERLK